MTLAPTRALHHGAQIPAIGLGTYSLVGDAGVAAIRNALDLGYRMLDTAENYRNEEEVGRAVRESGIDRESIFVTTKFNREWHSINGVRQTHENSLRRLGLDYVDLLLVHWPNPDQDQYVDALRGLGALWEEGKIRAFGTSNFKAKHLQRVLDETGLTPDVNQIQLSPYTIRSETRAYDDSHGIITESWSPIGGSGDELRSDAVITEIAQTHGRSPAQVVLRWHTQLGLIPIPKSADPQRQADNLAIFDFELTADQLAQIAGLDQGEQHAVDSDQQGH